MKSIRISFLLAACLLLVSSWAVAQAPANDILYLKDGSVIRGTLIESITGSHVRFKNLEGEVKQYPIAEVERTAISGKGNRSAVELKRIGYSHISSLGVLIGQSLYYGNSANPSFQTINGVRIGRHWSAGIGTGLESFGSGAQLPIFAHGRYMPLKGNVSPYVDAMAGYAFALSRPYSYYDDAYVTRKAGVTGGIGGGVRFMTSNRFGVTIGMGYRFQRLSSSYNTSFWSGGSLLTYPVHERTDMHRIEARVGILFN
jgi:hypothetical protein